MSYDQFVEIIEKKLQARVGENRSVCIHSATKNNGKIRKGITFIEVGINISPTIYMEEYYERFQAGTNLDNITRQVLELYSQVRMHHSWEASFLKEYDKVKGRIIYQLINRKANMELLKDLPYVPYLDLAIVFYVLVEVDKEKEQIATMLIKPEHLQWWKVTEDELFRVAHANTCTLLPYEFSTMRSVIGQLMKEDGEEIDGLEDQEDEMYVLTNSMRNFGASVILYENRLSEIGDFLKENYYVLPSSVHEVIVVPESKGTSQKDLSAVVKEINETQLEEEEILSNHAYYYDWKEKALMM